MAYKVRVVGLSSWSHNGKKYREGEHVVDDPTVMQAAKRAHSGHADGKQFGVFASETNDELTGSSRAYHDYSPHPGKAPEAKPVEIEPGVFVPGAEGESEPTEEALPELDAEPAEEAEGEKKKSTKRSAQ